MLASCVLVLAACSARTHKLRIDQCPRVDSSGDGVDVRYLGAGGVLLSRGDDVILTGPLYSNPSIVEFLLDHDIRSDPLLIERLLPSDARKAQAILVGHSHYDHLMDTPYIALHDAKSADIYGSQTTRNLLASILPALNHDGRDVIALDDKAFDPWKGQDGEWVPVGQAARFRALRSEHSDQFELDMMGLGLPFHLGRGVAQHDASAGLPRRGSEWAEGTVFAYVIDFLDAHEKPVFRIYYQDSGTNGGIGLPDQALLQKWDGKAVDLAIICVGGAFERLKEHPQTLLRQLRPRYALLVHWEDFFVPQSAACVDKAFHGIPTVPRPFGFMRATEVERFRDRMDKTIRDHHLDTRSWLPCPTASTFRLPVGSVALTETKVPFDCHRFDDYPIPH